MNKRKKKKWNLLITLAIIISMVLPTVVVQEPLQVSAKTTASSNDNKTSKTSISKKSSKKAIKKIAKKNWLEERKLKSKPKRR